MKKETMTILKKTGRIACLTCITLGAVAVVTSTAAVNSAKEGFRYLLEKSKDILKENRAPQEDAAQPEPVCAEDGTAEAAESGILPETAVTEEAPSEEI